MKRVLIVSPHFPPVNAPDLHRVRLSLPYYRDHGWEPIVLACEPDPVTTQALEPLLADTLPDGVSIVRVRPSRPLPGVRNLAWRSWRKLAHAGDLLLKRERFDLVFFSTTQFTTFTLGPRWQKKFRVPFVCDLQDPWVNSFYDRHPSVRRPGGWKHHVSQWLAARLEGRTLAHAAGLMSVSPAYLEELDQRHPALRTCPRIVLPFGADERDWQPANTPAAAQNLFKSDSATFHLVAVGRGGDDLHPSVAALARALLIAVEQAGPSARRPWLQLIGTSYASPDRARPTFRLAPDLAAVVREHPARIGYFQALRCLRDADVVLVLGSRDAGYQPSKLHVAAGSGRPLVAVVWPESGLARAVPSLQNVHVLMLDADGSVSPAALRDLAMWLAPRLSQAPAPCPPPVPVPAGFHARELTRLQTNFFARLCS